MHLDEVPLRHQRPDPIAVGSEWGDERRQHHHPPIDEQLGHLANAADVLGAVGVGEAQVLAEAMAHVVAIEHVAGEALFKQGRINRVGQGALAGAREAREPKNGAAVAPLVGPGRPIHRGVVPHDVGGGALGGEGARAGCWARSRHGRGRRLDRCRPFSPPGWAKPPGRRPLSKAGQAQPAAQAQKLLTSSEIPISSESTSKARFTSRLPLAMARWAPR